MKSSKPNFRIYSILNLSFKDFFETFLVRSPEFLG